MPAFAPVHKSDKLAILASCPPIVALALNADVTVVADVVVKLLVLEVVDALVAVLVAAACELVFSSVVVVGEAVSTVLLLPNNSSGAAA